MTHVFKQVAQHTGDIGVHARVSIESITYLLVSEGIGNN